jgi:hypothetical protein
MRRVTMDWDALRRCLEQRQGVKRTGRELGTLAEVARRHRLRIGELERMCSEGQVQGAFRDLCGRWRVPLPLRVVL